MMRSSTSASEESVCTVPTTVSDGGDAISDIEAGVHSEAAALFKWIVAIARQQIRPHFQPEALPQFPQLPQLTEIIERRHALRARGRGPADRFLIVPDDSFDVHPPEVTRRIERDALERDRDFGRPAFRVHARARFPERIEIAVLARESSEDAVRPRARRIDHEDVAVPLSREGIEGDL